MTRSLDFSEAIPIYTCCLGIIVVLPLSFSKAQTWVINYVFTLPIADIPATGASVISGFKNENIQSHDVSLLF